MKKTPVRLALVSLIAVLSVFGLSQSPADAAGRTPSMRGLCCGS